MFILISHIHPFKLSMVKFINIYKLIFYCYFGVMLKKDLPTVYRYPCVFYSNKIQFQFFHVTCHFPENNASLLC